MSNLEKYELMYLRLLSVFSLVAFVGAAIYGILLGTSYYLIYTLIFLAVFNIFNIIKFLIVRKGLLTKHSSLFVVFRGIEILFILVCMFTLKDAFQWANMLLFLPIVTTALLRGTRESIKLTFFTYVFHSIAFYLAVNYNPEFASYSRTFLADTVFFLFFYCIPAVFAILCGMIHNDNMRNFNVIADLHEHLKEKYKQLEFTQNEVSTHYERLKEVNAKLEVSNENLARSVAQLYTLQRMSQAISTVFDIDQLLYMVNDAIIGVMGVDYSTIALVDKSSGRLKVHTTNLQDDDELVTMQDNLNSGIVLETLNSKKTYMDSHVADSRYNFIYQRSIKSLAIVPIVSKSKKMGVVIIEKKVEDAFVEESVNFLDMVSQQIGIALENAELYSEMKELAMRDCLTGVYNRLYFREYIKTAVEDARKNNYNLSLCIFDIDSFKKFNDTYGHLFGDKVIAEIANLVKKYLRKGDLIARYGGEEFVICLPRTSLKEAYEKIEELRLAINRHEISEDSICAFITASFGVASFPECASSEIDLIKSADYALYIAKSTGRNCVVLSNPIKIM